MVALSGLMPNVGCPRKGRRRLLTSIVQSVLMYGAPTWAHILPYNKPGVAAMAAVQRVTAIRSVCTYRSVSYDAVTVVALTVPVELLVEERHAAFQAKRAPWPTGDDSTFAPGARATASSPSGPRTLRERTVME